MPKVKRNTRHKSGGIPGAELPDIGQLFVNNDIINAVISERDKKKAL